MATPLTLTSTSALWLHASPRGTRSGFVALPDGHNGVVTITVLPKPWAPARGITREVEHDPGSTTHLVMFETEYAAIRSSNQVLGEIALGITSVASRQPDLLAVESPPKRLTLAPAPPIDPFSELIDLMLLADRGRVDDLALTFEGALAPSLLRLLQQERFLRVVEVLLFRARPRYAELTEVLGIPRGRLSERSLLLSMSSGVPRVESTFDEPTLDTPLLQVVASALRVIASDKLPKRISMLRPMIQSRAVQLLKHVSGVIFIERERAIQTAERLWLGPLDRPWQPALEMALPVLRNRAMVPEDGHHVGDPVAVQIRMEKFWEQCLETALGTVFPSLAVSRDASPAEGVNVPAPWGVPMDPDREQPLSTEAFPDFMLTAEGRVVVADAKYKLHLGGAPSSQDGYQLFAYSHLAILNGRPSEVALILYPARAGVSPSQIELARMRESDFPLWLATLPFPARTDVRSRANWSSYSVRLASHIRGLSSEWVPRRPTPRAKSPAPDAN